MCNDDYDAGTEWNDLWDQIYDYWNDWSEPTYLDKETGRKMVLRAYSLDTSTQGSHKRKNKPQGE